MAALKCFVGNDLDWVSPSPGGTAGRPCQMRGRPRRGLRRTSIMFARFRLTPNGAIRNYGESRAEPAGKPAERKNK